MRELGEFLGWFTVVFFSLSFLNPVVKYVQKTFVDTPTAKAMGFLGDETPVCFQ